MYNFKQHNSISTFWYLLSIIASIASLIALFSGVVEALIGLILFGLIVYYGYKERNRPKIHGLTIELNSGTTHDFLSKDKNGVDELFEAISEAVESNKPLLQTFNFEGDRIIGDKYEINHSEIGNVGAG